MRGAVRRRRSSLRVPVLRLSILMHLTHTRCACEASVSIAGSSHGFPSRWAHAAATRGACMPLMGRTCETLLTLEDCTDDCTNMTRRLPRSRCRRLHAGGRRTEACACTPSRSCRSAQGDHRVCTRARDSAFPRDVCARSHAARLLYPRAQGSAQGSALRREICVLARSLSLAHERAHPAATSTTCAARCTHVVHLSHERAIPPQLSATSALTLRTRCPRPAPAHETARSAQEVRSRALLAVLVRSSHRTAAPTADTRT